jgi:nucleotide-binding universal stress UspA family protein
MFERILVPLDGSTAGEAVLSQVRCLCRGGLREVILVRIEEPGPQDPGPGFQEETLELAREYLRHLTSVLKSQGIRSKPVARIGPVAETILEIVREEKASLIAMATHGRTASESLPFGGVAKQLIRSSPVPLWVTPSFAPAHAAFASHLSACVVRTILVTTDGSKASLAVLPIAEAVATLFGSRILLLHGTGPGGATDVDDWMKDLAREIQRRSIPVETLIQAGEPVDVILDGAAREKAELLAMTTHGKGGGSGRAAGSVVEAVLKRTVIPLLIARASD